MKDNVIIEFDWDTSKAYTSIVPVECKAENGRRFRKITSKSTVVIKNNDMVVMVAPNGDISICNHERKIKSND